MPPWAIKHGFRCISLSCANFSTIKSSKGKNKGKSTKKVRNNKPVRNPGNLDALAYRRLLVDPCNAALVNSPYAGAMAQGTQRTVNTFTNGSSYFMYAYHPLHGLFGVGTADPGVPVSFGQVIAGPVARGASGRAIAGCLSCAWTGTESNRRGTVATGVIPGSILFNFLAGASGGANLGISVLSASDRLTEVCRMPVDKCEVNWFPSEGDQELTPPLQYDAGSNDALQVIFAHTNFCCMIINNVVGADVMVKVVGINETNNQVDSGPLWMVSSPVKPTFDWHDVVSSLSKVDSGWFLGTFKKVANLVSGTAMGYASMGLPGALGYLTSQMAGASISGTRTRGT